jgi:hypothetical protein
MEVVFLFMNSVHKQKDLHLFNKWRFFLVDKPREFRQQKDNLHKQKDSNSFQNIQNRTILFKFQVVLFLWFVFMNKVHKDKPQEPVKIIVCGLLLKRTVDFENKSRLAKISNKNFKTKISKILIMSRIGIEPMTQGFSVLCSNQLSYLDRNFMNRLKREESSTVVFKI